MAGEPLAEWAVEIDGSGPRAILAEIMAEWETGLGALDQLARGTRLQVDTTALAGVKKEVDAARAAMTTPGSVAGAPNVTAAKVKAPEVEEAKPITIQAHLASEPIKLVREQLTAARKDAEGVGAALRLAFQAGEEFKFPDEYRETLQGVQRDFLAGRATAEEAQRAITMAGRSAMEEFRGQEQAKQEEAKRTEQALREQADANRDSMRGVAGAVMSMTATGGSLAAMFLDMQRAQEEAAGASEEQLFNLDQMAGTIPHITSGLSGIAALASGNILGGVTGIITGIVGLFTTLNKPMKQEPARKEGIEDTFARIQTGAMKGSDVAQASRDKMATHLANIEKNTGGGTPRPSPVGS